MDAAGDNASAIEKKTGIPRNTTGRFLKGEIGEPRSSTVRAWAALYNITESQLRGDVEIEGMDKPAEELRNMLSVEEYQHLSNIKKMGGETREIVFKLSSILVNQTNRDRRTKEKTPNNQLRVGEVYYQSPPRKRRIMENIDAKKKTGT